MLKSLSTCLPEANREACNVPKAEMNTKRGMTQFQDPSTSTAQSWGWWWSLFTAQYLSLSHHSDCFRIEELLRSHGREVGNVHQDVDHHDYGHADYDRPREVLHWILDLLCHEVELIPTVVVPQSIECDQTDAGRPDWVQEFKLFKTFKFNLWLMKSKNHRSQ